MAESAREKKPAPTAPQKVGVLSGNEMAALAANHINFHIMGYYPITPSTEIAETLDEMKAEGEHDVLLIPGDGEHGAAGICYGATAGGGRVFNATSANGLLFSMEQLPVQSGTRFPMVLDVVTRSFSGPLDIRGDHSDIMAALNMGWVILMAKNPQEAYDMNIIAVKVGEHPEVRLPVIVAFDGFFTSHQKRKVQYFADRKYVQEFLGHVEAPYHALDPRRPLTIGPYMNDPDFINNKKQQSLAMEVAYSRVIPQVFREYAALSGRSYDFLDTYRIEDAEAVLVILNSAGETAKLAVDDLRDQGKKVGLVIPQVIRPFPAEQVRTALRGAKAVLVADRQESFGGWGGNMTLEVKAALKDDPENRSIVLSRIYGLGGKEFFLEDAVTMLNDTLQAAWSGKALRPFEYVGATEGNATFTPRPAAPPITKEASSPGLVKVKVNEQTGRLEVLPPATREVTMMPKRISGGHGACPGCGIFPSVDIFMKALEGHVVVLFHTGCGMVVTTGYPYSAHNVTYIHNLFQNGAATIAGLVEMFHERQRRGELPKDEEITFLMVSGDGGLDIGIGPAIGSALRNHKMILLEYDNEGYMNTGHQLSFTTPLGDSTSTSHAGPHQKGKRFHHRDTAQIFAALNVPYAFTGAESDYRDLMKKAAKAQWYAQKEGFVFGRLLSACPLNWRSPDEQGAAIVGKAVDSCFFPLYEVEKGKTVITYNPEAKGKKVPVSEWLKTMGKSRHMLKPENKDVLDAFQAEVDRRWTRLKAMHDSPVL